MSASMHPISNQKFLDSKFNVTKSPEQLHGIDVTHGILLSIGLAAPFWAMIAVVFLT